MKVLFNKVYLLIAIILGVFLIYSYNLTSYTKSSKNHQKAIIISKDSAKIKKNSLTGRVYYYTVKYNDNQNYTFPSYYESYKLQDSIKICTSSIGIYVENDMSNLYPIFGIIFFMVSFYINRKLIESNIFLTTMLVCVFYMSSCAKNDDYSRLKTMLDDINNIKTTRIEKLKNKLVINFQIKDSLDCERYASKSAIVATIYHDSNHLTSTVDTILINIKSGKTTFSKAYGKNEINKVNQCLLSLSPTLQMLQNQKYSDFITEVFQKSDNNLIAGLSKADKDLGKIEKIDILGFVQKDNIIKYILYLKRGNVNNRLDLKVDIQQCKITEIDM